MKAPKKNPSPKTSRWVMCAKSESGDDYCCCGVWDHKPTQEEIDRVRVSLDSCDPDDPDDVDADDFLVTVDGRKYSCFIADYEVSEIEV